MTVSPITDYEPLGLSAFAEPTRRRRRRKNHLVVVDPPESSARSRSKYIFVEVEIVAEYVFTLAN